MKTLLIACCELCVIDARTNNLSIINTIEEMHSPTFPFVMERLAVVALTERSTDEDSVVETKIKGNIGGDVLFEYPVRLDFQDRRRTRSIVYLQGLVIPSPGDLIIVQKLEERELATWSIRIDQIGLPKADLFTARDGEPPIPAS